MREKYKEILSTAVKAAQLAGEVQKEYLGHQDILYHRKEHYDIVTEVDYLCERKIISAIRESFPSHCILSEEVDQSCDANSDYLWIVDPLDGTVNYTSGIPLFGTSIGVQEAGETIVGVVYAPMLEELYTAVRGEGARLNGEPVQVSSISRLSDAVLSVMLTSHYSIPEVEKATRLIHSLSSSTRGIRIFVSQAVELGYIATGRIDAHICIKSRGFSSAAGKLLVSESGGRITELTGAAFSPYTCLIVSNGRIHEDLLKIVEEEIG